MIVTHCPTRRLDARKLRALLGLSASLSACAPSDFDALEHERGPSLIDCEVDADDPDCPARPDASSDGDAALPRAHDAARRDRDAREPDDWDSSARPVLDAGYDIPAPGPDDAGEGLEGDSDLPSDASCTDCQPDAADDAGDAGAACPTGAPVCEPGQRDSDSRSCGDCGSGMQIRTRSCARDGCRWGEWSAWSACANVATECTPGRVDTGMQPCGLCGSGTQTRTRSCSSATCSWSPWSEWSVCSPGTTQCMPNQTDTQTEPCGACNTGKRTRTRSCSATSCTWGAWGTWSACAGITAACTPGETTDCSPADSCGQRVCSNSCTWGGCVPRSPGGCLRRRNGTQEEGSNYQCCAGAQAWRFCLPSCAWANECAACSSQYCEC